MAENKASSKIRAHSGVCLKVKTRRSLKPVKLETEPKNNQVDTSSTLTKKNESRTSYEVEETITSTYDLETSLGSPTELCDQCKGICKCIKILRTVCSPQEPKKSKLLKTRKDTKESRSISPSKSVKTQQITNNSLKAKKTESSRQPVCSELNSRNSKLPKLRPPSICKSKPAIASKTHQANVKTQSTTVSTPQPAIATITTQPECVSDTLPGSESSNASESKPPNSSELISFSDGDNYVSVTKPLTPLNPTISDTDKQQSVPRPSSFSESALLDADKHSSVSDSSCSSEPTLSVTDQFESPDEPFTVKVSLPSRASDLANVVEFQSSDRPAFWPPNVVTYEIISVPPSYPVSPIKWRMRSVQKSEPLIATETFKLVSAPSKSCEFRSSNITNVPNKCVSTTRTSKIPKIQPNPVKDSKVKASRETSVNLSCSKLQKNLKQPEVKISSSNKRITKVKTICDGNEQKQTKLNEKKTEGSQKKSSK